MNSNGLLSRRKINQYLRCDAQFFWKRGSKNVSFELIENYCYAKTIKTTKKPFWLVICLIGNCHKKARIFENVIPLLFPAAWNCSEKTFFNLFSLRTVSQFFLMNSSSFSSLFPSTLPPKKRSPVHYMAFYWPAFQSHNLHSNIVIFMKALIQSCGSWLHASLTAFWVQIGQFVYA